MRKSYKRSTKESSRPKSQDEAKIFTYDPGVDRKFKLRIKSTTPSPRQERTTETGSSPKPTSQLLSSWSTTQFYSDGNLIFNLNPQKMFTWNKVAKKITKFASKKLLPKKGSAIKRKAATNPSLKVTIKKSQRSSAAHQMMKAENRSRKTMAKSRDASISFKKASKKSPNVQQKETVDGTENMAYILPIGSITNIYERIYDCCCFFIHCLDHSRICVLKSSSSPYIWLPFVAHQPKCSWTLTARDNIALILSYGSNSRYEYLKKHPPYGQLQLMEILRLQVPQTRRFIARIAFYVPLNVTDLEGKFSCCTNTERLSWLDIDFVQKGLVENIWGPEMVEFCQKFMAYKSKNILDAYVLTQKITEFGSNQVFHYNPTSDTPKNLEESLLKAIEITENDIERLYLDFLEHCYPSFYMTFDSFRQYMSRNGIDTADFNMKRLFNAFNYMMNGYLCFHELLLGLVAIELDTPHDEVRIKFVYRYYDIKKQGLHEEDLKKLIRDLALQKDGKVLDEAEANRRTKEAMEKLFQTKVVRGHKVITYKKFLTAIATHQFRGTSLLCRTKKSIFVHIAKRMAAQTISQNRTQQLILGPVVTKKYYPEICKSCLNKKYKLSSCMTTINQDSYMDKVDLIKLVFDDCGGKWDEETIFSVENFQKILPLLRPEHPANFFLKKIREYNQVKNKNGSDVTFGFMTEPNQREMLINLFQKLYSELEYILKSERRVKYIYSPCFIIGDIHGNLEDLMSLEGTIWKQFPCASTNYLFLGDYVDRGRWSIECALYLFSMKVLRPKIITLLRGNHEIRDIQAKYTYKRELFFKYEQYGQKIWEMTNKLFDLLPLCAVLDDVIYAAHGGIPHQTIDMVELEQLIPPSISSPEIECPVAWEIMWSDPIHFKHFQIILNMYEGHPPPNPNDPMLMSPHRKDFNGLREGYIHNTKRGTAFYFNEKAVEIFFMKNGLTHIVRAHEVPKLGFMFHFEHKCITIFSCSHYCGNENECAVLFVDQGKIRIIRIDTSSNVSATD